MSPETFFDNFGYLADAPGGVAKLRELILDLAVRGKLVEQDPEDELAEALLTKIQANHCGGSSNGELRQVGNEDAELRDVPFELPSNWKWAQFCEVATIASNLVKPQDFEGFPHIAPNNIEKASGRLLEYQTVADDKVRSANHRFFAGQILYSKIRPNLSKATLVHFDGLCSADMYPLNCHIEANYLLAYILSSTFLSMVVKTDTRVAMPKINQKELNRVIVPVAPLAEQKRIVAKVDELMGLCDRLEARQAEQRALRESANRASLDHLLSAGKPRDFQRHWQRIWDHFDILYDTPANLTQLRQAILRLAVQGKLVAQDPNDEPASELLEQIVIQRREWFRLKLTKKQRELPPVSDAERNDRPPKWGDARLGDLIDARFTLSYGVLVPGPDIVGGVPFVRISDLAITNQPAAPAKSIDPEIDAKFERTRLLGGEILLAVVGSIGKIGVVPETWAGANIARAICRIVPASQTRRDYILLVLQSPQIQSYFARVTRTLAQPTLNIGEIEKTVIPLPPLAEQKRIVAKVDQLMSICDTMEAKLTESESASRDLLDAMVHALLNGE